MTNKEVMIDLETLGTGNKAAIIAIGAVEFDVKTGQLGREFYTNVNPETCTAIGMNIDASTVMWWLGQSLEARTALQQKGIAINIALMQFNTWFDTTTHGVWGNGATFDNVIMTNAYKLTGMIQPWKFYQDRCYRTLKSVRPDIVIDRVGVHHNALDDAKTQALHAIKLLNEIGVTYGSK